MRTLTPQEFQFVGPTNITPVPSGFDLSPTPLIDAERTINLFYEPAYNGARPALISTPGLSGVVATLAGVPANKNVRMLYGNGPRLFAVGGAHFYEVGTDVGVGVIQDYGTMAGDAGTSTLACKMRGAQNTPMGMVSNPFAAQLYSIDFVGHSLTSRFNALDMEYLDGFFLGIATGASLAGTNPNQVNASAFNDGTTWPALAFVLKEGSSDPLVALAVVNNLLWIMGQKNIEIWYNAGLPNFPFARVNGGTINTGCISAQTVVNVANSLMWVGSSERGWGNVYLANGFQPQRVSTYPIEQLIRTAFRNSSSPNAFGYEEQGHAFYVLNLVGWGTVVYDLTTGVWHERAFWNGTQLVQGADKPFCFASINNGSLGSTFLRNFAGDSTNGNIYRYGQEYTSNNSAAIQRVRISSHITNGERWMKYPRFEVLADVGPIATATVTLTYSNDGGQTYPALHRSDLTQTGVVPQNVFNSYKKFVWRQCGRAKRRAIGVQILDGNNPIRIFGGILRVEEGTEF